MTVALSDGSLGLRDLVHLEVERRDEVDHLKFMTLENFLEEGHEQRDRFLVVIFVCT